MVPAIPTVEAEAETPLLSDVVRGSIDFKSRPAARSRTGRWKSASFIIGVELAERIAYFGISSNLISYLTGPVGQSTSAAAANVNTWSGTAWILPLVGGFIADSCLGRFRMIISASLLYILGLGFLSLSAAFHSDSSDCQDKRNSMMCFVPQLEIIFFFLSLYLTAFAQGGNKPCVLAFAADQFDEENEEECNAKSSLFNWWNCVLGAVTMLGVLVLNYIQDNLSWEISFGIPCIFMCFALLVFLLGITTYRFHIDSVGKSPLVSVYKVIRKAARDWMARTMAVSVDREIDEPIQPHEGEDGTPHISQNVEATKAVLGLVAIWSSCLGYTTLHSQISTLFVKQAATMDRYITSSFQIPVASIQSSVEVAFIIFIPMYDRILVPVARGITKKQAGISMLQRVGTGLFFSLVAMMIAALVERKRLAVAHKYGLVDTKNATLPMSVWWLAPQNIIFGVADGFSLVGLQEFFYNQVPRELRSIGVALYLSVIGVGHLLSSFVVCVVAKLTSGHGEDGWVSDNLNRGHLDYMYWLMCGIGWVAFVAYLYFAKSYASYRRGASVL